MDRNLQTLVDLRRGAEESARFAMEESAASRAREETVQADLLARWRMAQHALEREPALGSGTPATAGEATARERYRSDLASAVARIARLAEAHRAGPLALALGAESEGRAAFEEACQARKAVETLKERAEAEEAKLALRRAEDAASDHANAIFVKSLDR